MTRFNIVISGHNYLECYTAVAAVVSQIRSVSCHSIFQSLFSFQSSQNNHIIVRWNLLDSSFHKVTQSVVDPLPLPLASMLHPSQLLFAKAVAEVQ